MDTSLKLSSNLSLSQTLSPQMIQSLKLLEYNALELTQTIREELLINPLLEEIIEQKEADKELDEILEAQSDDREEIKDSALEDVEYDDHYDETLDLGYSINRKHENDDNFNEPFERKDSLDISLEEHLMAQLRDMRLSDKKMEIAEYVIASINEKGFLVCDTEQVAEKFEVSEKVIEEIIFGIQKFEPAGIAARSLKESLLIQMYKSGNTNLNSIEIIENYFDLLEKNNIPAIAKKMKISISEVQTAIMTIGRLHPSPGSLIGVARTEMIIPDIIVDRDSENGTFDIILADSGVPELTVSGDYSTILKDRKSDKKTKKFLRENLNSANWLIRAIEQRRSTMVKVMGAIVERQSKWFVEGPPNILPLIRQTIADMTDLHVSTVSRVTGGKYVQTEFGVFELAYFFGSSIAQNDGSEISAMKTKNIIIEIIESEDKISPYSDQQIVQILSNRNIKIARRTVSKYREALNILPKKMRREFK